MKKISFLIAFGGIISILATSCQPSLDVSPKGYISSGTFFKNATDAKATLVGAYSVLFGIYRNEHILTPNEICADNAIPFLTGGADRVAIWRYEHNSMNLYPGQIWSSAYQGIQYCNVLIDRVPLIDMDETLKNEYIAEARFLRALHYFNLVRFFGGVPLVLKETTSLDDVEIAQSPVEEVYSAIEADLLAAESSLPNKRTDIDVGRATSGAAKGLLAKVLLTKAGNNPTSQHWATAAQKAKEVIDSGIYSLESDFADVFKKENRGGKESIFEVVFVTDIYGNGFTTGFAPRGAPIVPNGGFGIFRVTASLFNEYKEEDKRKPVTFLTSYVHPTTQETVQLSVQNPDPALAVSFWKLADPDVSVGLNGGTSWPYMRFSELLLIYAEALNESNNGPTSEAYAALNSVRHRAGLSPVSNLSRTEFKEAILLERRLELAFEGHRWFDLTRTGKLVDAVKKEGSFGRNAPIQNFHTLFPIPFREVEANRLLDQNNGY